MNYKIVFKGKGNLGFAKLVIHNFDKYESIHDPRLPQFNEAVIPVTHGVNLLAASGQLDVVYAKDYDSYKWPTPEKKEAGDIGKNPEKFVSEDKTTSSEDSEEESSEDKEEELPEVKKEPSGSAKTPSQLTEEVETEEVETEEVETVEINGKDVPITEEGLKELLLDELKDICRKYKIRGFSKHNEDGIIELILENKDQLSEKQ